MAPTLAPASVWDACCAGEPVSVGGISHVFLLLCLVAGCQALAAAGQPTVALGAQGLQPFKRARRSGWFVLSWLLAGFLHSRHGITITKCHHRFGSSARQTGYIKGPGCSLALERVSRALARGRALPAAGRRKGCPLHSMACRGAGAGRFFVPLGNLAASKETQGSCQSAFR